MIIYRIFFLNFILIYKTTGFINQDIKESCLQSSEVYDAKKAECKQCQTGCLTCNISTCLSCSKSYLFMMWQNYYEIKQDSTSVCVKKCPQGYYSQNFDGICYKCYDQKCLDCNSFGQCNKCVDGFNLVEGVCISNKCQEKQGLYSTKKEKCTLDCELENTIEKALCSIDIEKKEYFDDVKISQYTENKSGQINKIQMIKILEQTLVSISI